jgi:hypothetical protein
MPNALTLETMSPGLLKVGGTRHPEPHRRKSRMREIRSSGSGEGLGWATSQPTLQRYFCSSVYGNAPLEPPPPVLVYDGHGVRRCLGASWEGRRERASIVHLHRGGLW